MEEYKKRMIEEYRELKERYRKLLSMLVKQEDGVLDFKLNCPVELLRQQAEYMGKYLKVLETRAAIEGIEL